jgi:hypothetical protein
MRRATSGRVLISARLPAKLYQPDAAARPIDDRSPRSRALFAGEERLERIWNENAGFVSNAGCTS